MNLPNEQSPPTTEQAQSSHATLAHEPSNHATSNHAASDASTGNPHRFLILGGGGRMGRLFHEQLVQAGQVVEVFDINDPRSLASLVKRFDVVMISVPMSHAVDVAKQVAPLMPGDGLLCDLNSLKAEMCRAMAESPAAEVVGLHPMFGPTVPRLQGQKMVVCPQRSGPRTTHLLGLLGQMGLEMIETDPETHDRMMAAVQVLVHFSTLVLGSALQKSGVSLEQSLQFTSPIYRIEMALLGRLFAQDPQLYAEIEMSNPFAESMRQHFIDAAGEWNQIIAQQDRSQFCNQFGLLKDFFADFADDSMELSDFLIDCVTKDIRS